MERTGQPFSTKLDDHMQRALEENHGMTHASGIEGDEENESNEVVTEIRKEWQKPRLLHRTASQFRLEGFQDEYLPPVWWFQHFDPCWAPLRTWLRQKQALTLSEFQWVADHVSGLTSIEKTIAVSAFVVHKNLSC